MKTTIRVVVILLAMAGFASAQTNGQFGAGVILGDPTGISLKYWTSPKIAWDAAIAWSLEHNESLHLHIDYLVHNFDDLKADKGRLAWYYGIGGRVVARDKGDDVVGVRFPLGLDYFFANAPFDLFAEIAPVLEVAPNTELDIDAGVGVRFYFR